MSLISDQNYLKNSQYQRPNNLDARMQIHLRFSRNAYGWSRWVFDHLNLRPGMRVLELGCGMGSLWRENLARVPQGVQLTLTDFSRGMVAEAGQHLGGDERFVFAECDAQAMPLASESFDLVVANHMLYHVPDLPLALAEIRRVLRPEGHLAAATNGPDHMHELYELVRQFDPGLRQDNNSAARFGLQNGDAQLAPFFQNRDLFIYDDSLWITEAQPLVRYIASMWGMGLWGGIRESNLEALITSRIKENGGIYIRKSSGLFWARRS